MGTHPRRPRRSPRRSSSRTSDWARNFYDDEGLRMHRAPLPEPPTFLVEGCGEIKSMNDDRGGMRIAQTLPSGPSPHATPACHATSAVASPEVSDRYGKCAQTTSLAACLPPAAAHRSSRCPAGWRTSEGALDDTARVRATYARRQLQPLRSTQQPGTVYLRRRGGYPRRAVACIQVADTPHQRDSRVSSRHGSARECQGRLRPPPQLRPYVSI